LEKAFEYYKIAAEKGHCVAQYSLGVCYELGKGVEKNKAKAFEYYEKSAEQGDVDAQLVVQNCNHD
jgi:uncharacterized protein